MHEKITGLEMSINKKKEVKEIKKEEEKKLFSNEEIKDVLEVIITLRNQILEKRIKLNNINSESEEKMHEYFAQNRNIELELKENLIQTMQKGHKILQDKYEEKKFDLLFIVGNDDTDEEMFKYLQSAKKYFHNFVRKIKIYFSTNNIYVIYNY